MPFTRRLSEADAVDAGYPNYRVVMAASPESATVVGCFLGDGGHPPLHVHDVDLFYVVLAGTATVRLGHDSHQAQAGELIFIPAGVPHGSDNHSGAAEHHLEILVPGVRPGAPYLRPVPSADATALGAAAPYVASVVGEPTRTVGQERRWLLADESKGARGATITAVERAGPEAPGPLARGDTDRLVVLTSGRLDTEIGGLLAGAPAQAVILIPAGVEYRIWNSSPEPARYLDAEIQVPDQYAKLALAE
jgi:mannose-6-phosphate isomerase-like protein (cupin superfamily)